MSRLGYVAILSAVFAGGLAAQKSTAPRSEGPWNYDSSSNLISAPAGSRVAIGSPCPAGAPVGSVCMNGQAIAPIAVSALPAAFPGNANVMQVVSNTTNCTSTSGSNPMLCMSTGTAWVPLGGGTTPSPYTGGLVAEYRLDEAVGRTAFNSVYPHVVTNNLLGSLTGFSAGQGINTVNYAMNRDGLQIASRLQLAGSGNIEYLACAGAFVSGQTYTISMDAMSNTGTAQVFRLGTIYEGAVSPNLTAGTTWGRVSYTFTATSSSQYIIVYTDAAGDSLDISYDRLQAETGPSATAWDSHLWNVQLGSSKWVSDGTAPSWANSPWLTFTGAERAYGLGNWSPITLSTMSAYAVVWQSSDTTAGQPVFGDDNQQVGLWANYVSGPSYRANFGSAMLPPNGVRVGDGNPHVLAATYDGTTLTAYLDGIAMASTAAAVSPITLNGIGLGNIANSYKFNGKIGYASLYSTAHSAAAVAANSAILKARMAQLGVTIPAWRNWVMFEGDSITAGAAGTPFGYTAQTAITPYPQGIITAVPGSNISDLVSREAADNALLQPSPTRNILTVLIGANDLGDAGGASGFVGNVKSYCLAMRAAGWKIVVLTVLPRTYTGFNAWRNEVNSLIVADTSFYDAIVRLDLDPVIGCDACAANTTYYNADGLHPNTAGENVIAADLVSVLRSVLQ